MPSWSETEPRPTRLGSHFRWCLVTLWFALVACLVVGAAAAGLFVLLRAATR